MDALAEEVRREGLDDVVVDAGFDGFDDAAFFGFSRNHDDGRGFVGATPGLDEGEAVHVGHVPVNQHEVGAEGRGLAEGVLTVASFEDFGVTELRENSLLDVSHCFGIVYEENPHGSFPDVLSCEECRRDSERALVKQRERIRLWRAGPWQHRFWRAS